MNKSDRPGADSAVLSLQTTLQLRYHDENTYLPKIFKCIASKGEGIESIIGEIFGHRNFMHLNNGFINKRKKNNQIELMEL